MGIASPGSRCRRRVIGWQWRGGRIHKRSSDKFWLGCCRGWGRCRKRQLHSHVDRRGRLSLGRAPSFSQGFRWRGRRSNFRRNQSRGRFFDRSNVVDGHHPTCAFCRASHAESLITGGLCVHNDDVAFAHAQLCRVSRSKVVQCPVIGEERNHAFNEG